MTSKQQSNYLFPLIIVFVVCFLIGFITTMNNSMIEFCKEAFRLSDTQGQLVNTFFYGAYFFSIPFAMMMNHIGYKATLILGLMVVGMGFIANNIGVTAFLGTSNVYIVFLCSMSIVALGVVMLQLVTNPYVMVLGNRESSAFRMTLSQALNSVATTVAPIFITTVIIAGKPKLPENVPAPFLMLGVMAIAIGLILVFIKLPDPDKDNAAKAETDSAANAKEYKSSVFKYPHVWFGAIAIVMYLGIELGIPSMLPAYWKSDPTLSGSATQFLPFYWGGMMVGRFVGSAVLAKYEPRAILNTCLLMGAFCVLLSFVLPGIYAVYAMLATGLFHSVMWPLIFNLGLRHLGPHTKKASGILNMGVLGGATLPLLMGIVVDHPSLGVAAALMLMFPFYAYVMWFCNWGSRIGISRP
jgi:FHS family L-fucose permease-like MFS transporter